MKPYLVGLAIIAVVAVLGAAAYERFWPQPAPATTATTGQQPAAASIEVRPNDMVIGRAEAPVTVVEYASLTCPHCADFHAKTLPGLKQKYIDAGQVRLVYRDFPLDGIALRAAMLAHCAGPERYFPLLETLFALQQQWGVNQASDLPQLAQVARQAGIGDQAFKACIANKEIEAQVLKERQEGEILGVNATPTLFINGVKHTGELTLDQIGAVIDPLLAKP